MSSQQDFRKRIIFVDIDGTLIDHASPVLRSASDAIKSARNNGHLVYISTGRGATDIPRSVREIGFDGEITNGGAFAQVGDELILSRPMAQEDLAFLIDYFESRGVSILVQTHEKTYTTPGAHALMSEYARFLDQQKATEAVAEPEDFVEGPAETFTEFIEGFDFLDDSNMENAAKLLFISNAPVDMAGVEENLGDRFHIIPGSMPISQGADGEISPLGVSKGSAIEAVLEHVGIPAEDAVGIGDSWNDVEMFDICGEAVAMAGADEGVKARANRVTTSVREGGVHKAFADLGLI